MEIRKLTRKEQLDYYIPFLEVQINALILELEKAKEELDLIDKDNLILERKNDYGRRN